jgi:cytochrome c oxidase subunit 2
MALIAYTTVRFRARRTDADREPPQIYGSNQLELAWTVVPIIVVFVLSLVTVRTILALQIDERPEGWLPVTVVGHQWWWEFQYPEHGITTANELHLPVDRATFLDLRSADVVHSFWVPQLAGKTDVIPNHENHMWIEPSTTGLFVGQCAEYCGTQHANMLLRVYVHTREDFELWAAAEARDAVTAPGVEAGREVFLGTACINCHTVRGTVANGRFGPDLTHLMRRDTLASGSVPNDPANLKAWIDDPDHLKRGALMPAMGLDDRDLDALVAYLLTLE